MQAAALLACAFPAAAYAGGMATERELETLRRALRAKLHGSGGSVAVDTGDLRTLLDELGRLAQSNDRLRRQNRRVRLKLQRAGIAEDAADADGGDGPADDGSGSSVGDPKPAP
jgi:hypothetical protein